MQVIWSSVMPYVSCNLAFLVLRPCLTGCWKHHGKSAVEEAFDSSGEHRTHG